MGNLEGVKTGRRPMAGFTAPSRSDVEGVLQLEEVCASESSYHGVLIAGSSMRVVLSAVSIMAHERPGLEGARIKHHYAHRH
jgi:hypothetical protein